MDAKLEGDVIVARVPIDEIHAEALLAVYDAASDSCLPEQDVAQLFALARIGLVKWVEDGDGYWKVTALGAQRRRDGQNRNRSNRET